MSTEVKSSTPFLGYRAPFFFSGDVASFMPRNSMYSREATRSGNTGESESDRGKLIADYAGIGRIYIRGWMERATVRGESQ